ncbi:hypothetical protein KM043_012679 [Ampulex compressa]|nr:hypothetical protein KM043_012679 [Ampulex compressa]
MAAVTVGQRSWQLCGTFAGLKYARDVPCMRPLAQGKQNHGDMRGTFPLLKVSTDWIYSVFTCPEIKAR